METLKEVLEKNKQKYIDRLSELVAIDTHDLGHGIERKHYIGLSADAPGFPLDKGRSIFQYPLPSWNPK